MGVSAVYVGPGAAVLALTLVGGALGVSAGGEEAKFLTENTAAMEKMMAAMTVSPSGDVDQDFAAIMVPHHRGAIEMAQAELRYGHNEQLRRLAQEIIVEQTQEIAVIRQAVAPRSPRPDSVAPTRSSTESGHPE